jgi:hypothetical protein
MHDRLPELAELERCIETLGTHATHESLGEIGIGRHSTPRLKLHALTLGNPDPAMPGFAVIGGVHGLERIGTQVVIAFLQSLAARLRWDVLLHQQLESLRLVVIPMLNPGGFWRRTRANPQGVDLMRNAPIEAEQPVPRLLGGQRLSPSLPWFRGAADAPMQPEAQALCDLITRELLPRPFSLAIDCHSGFGTRDQLWFPYAHTTTPIAHLAEIHALAELLDDGHLYHRYTVEPQSRHYLTHGDLWDFLYQRALTHSPAVFLPLTLEMGSWLWVKKNPLQLFSRHGMFNPQVPHRWQRVLRRHMNCLDFLARACVSHAHWLPTGSEREPHTARALARWYA